MTTPQPPRGGQPRQSVPKYVAGAIDLGDLKAQADARAQAEKNRAAAQQRPSGGAPRSGEGAGSGISPVIDVTPQNFENEVVRRSLQVPVIVLVGSHRSPDSENLDRDLEALAREDNLEWIFARVDADSQPEVAGAFGVQGLPTVIALAGARPLSNFEGGQPKEALRQWVDAVIKSVAGKLQGIPDAERGASSEVEEEAAPEDPRLDRAEAALNEGDFQAALDAYDEILESEPNHPQAKAARGNVALLKRISDAHNNAGGGELAEPEKSMVKADEFMVSGQESEAFAVLLDALRSQVGDNKTAVKDRLVELLNMCDPADPRVADARREMASALF